MANEERHSGARLAVLFGVLSLALILSNFQRLSLAVIGDDVIRDTGITVAELAAIGAAIFYPYALMQIPSGMAGDKFSSRRILMFSCAVAGTAAMIFAFAGSFIGLVGARVLTGLGTAFVYVPSLAVIRREFGDERYGTMAGIYMAIGGISGICASAPLRLLADYVSWRTIFIGIGALEFLMMATAPLTIPTNRTDPSKKLGGGFRTMLSPGMASIWVWITMTVGTNLAIVALWGGRFFTDSIGLDKHDAAIGLMMMNVGNVVGSFIFGSLADKFGSIRIVTGASLVNAGFLVWLGLMPAGTAPMTVFILSLMNGFFNQGACTSGFASIKHFVPAQYNGLASGTSNCWNFVGSALFTQLAGTYMACVGGSTQEQYRALFFSFAALVAFAGILVGIVNWKIFSKR